MPVDVMASAHESAVFLGGVPINPLTMVEAVDAVEDLVRAGRGGAVFTPNVNHVVLCQQNARLREAYERVSLSLADGMPVVWGARALGYPVPEKVSGSDFVTPLLGRAAARGWRVVLLGGAEGIGARAAAHMIERHPALHVVATLAPVIDLELPAHRRAHVVAALKAARPHLVLVALGAPKQELSIDEVRDVLAPAVLLGVGATLDFFAGAIPRAPGWMSRSGLEWLYRLSREPRRLWRRYLVRDPKFLGILLSEMLPGQTEAPSARWNSMRRSAPARQE